MPNLWYVPTVCSLLSRCPLARLAMPGALIDEQRARVRADEALRSRLSPEATGGMPLARVTWSRPVQRVRMAWWRRLTGRTTQCLRTTAARVQPGSAGIVLDPVRARGFGRPRRRPPELCEEH